MPFAFWFGFFLKISILLAVLEEESSMVLSLKEKYLSYSLREMQSDLSPH